MMKKIIREILEGELDWLKQAADSDPFVYLVALLNRQNPDVEEYGTFEYWDVYFKMPIQDYIKITGDEKLEPESHEWEIGSFTGEELLRELETNGYNDNEHVRTGVYEINWTTEGTIMLTTKDEYLDGIKTMPRPTEG